MNQPHQSPSSQNTFKGKLDQLWATNKILFFAIIALLTLIIFSIIFCVVYFLVIKPRQAQAQNTFTQPTATTPKAHDVT